MAQMDKGHSGKCTDMDPAKCGNASQGKDCDCTCHIIFAALVKATGGNRSTLAMTAAYNALREDSEELGIDILAYLYLNPDGMLVVTRSSVDNALVIDRVKTGGSRLRSKIDQRGPRPPTQHAEAELANLIQFGMDNQKPI